MPVQYTVVQCVPDPIADERINVGVLVFGDGQVRSRFVDNWSRVADFAQEDISYVQEFAKQLTPLIQTAMATPRRPTLPGMPELEPLDEAMLERMIGDWGNSIQFMPPQVSLQDADALLAELAALFLHERAPRESPVRSRSDVVRYAGDAVRDAFVQRAGPAIASHLVKTSYRIAGRLHRRLTVDVAVKNGMLYSASRSLSFELRDMSELDQQIRDAVLTLGDISQVHGGARLDVVASPPKEELATYPAAVERFKETEESCDRLGATLILIDEVPAWAEQLVDLVPRHELEPAHAW